MNDNLVFGKRLKEFFLEYLPKSKGCSRNTIKAYQFAFIAFCKFLDSEYNIKSGELDLDNFTYEVVNAFLLWSVNNNVSDSTRNQRQSALNSFAKYLLNLHPELQYELTKIINIPVKKAKGKVVSYVKLEGIDEILKQVDKCAKNGHRDYLILSLMSFLGLRVSEVITLRVSDISYSSPPHLVVTGKGNKQRQLPLSEKLITAIDNYLIASNIGNISNNHRLLFPNKNLTMMTRQNLSHLVEKYSSAAREKMQSDGRNFEVIPEKVTPHMLRHSAAMNMIVEKSIPLLVVKEILGHTSIQATEIYAQATRNQVREAVAEITSELGLDDEKPEWGTFTQGETIEAWLSSQAKSK